MVLSSIRQQKPTTKRLRRLPQKGMKHSALLTLLLCVQLHLGASFSVSGPAVFKVGHSFLQSPNARSASSPTALSVWWYGGSESTEASVTDADSCELVPVRIERPTSSSRKILGEIVASSPMEDVWSILTDYDRLAIHVPNLKESKVTQRLSGGIPGDGQHQCRLFQRGAQKIIGFEFGASVTMDMREQIISDTERRITFKCVDSMFFSEFDGEWKVTEQVGADGKPESVLSYVVVVRPNGPVPVAALEWRIREDVPTNLRAVKLAASQVTARSSQQHLLAASSSVNGKEEKKSMPGASLLDRMRNPNTWYEDETMAAYLTE